MAHTQAGEGCQPIESNIYLADNAGARGVSARLSGRTDSAEEEIAALVAQGLTNRQIASELSISEHAAATHHRRLLKKLKLSLSSRSQLSAWVMEARSASSDLG